MEEVTTAGPTMSLVKQEDQLITQQSSTDNPISSNQDDKTQKNSNNDTSSSAAGLEERKAIEYLLKDMNITEYEPAVVSSLLEFSYKFLHLILDDAKQYSSHANKQCLDVHDVKLAVKLRDEQDHSNEPLPRELLKEIAERKNSIPLPPVKNQAGLRLPNDRYCLTQTNYKLKSQSKLKSQALASSHPYNNATGNTNRGAAAAAMSNTNVGGYRTMQMPPQAAVAAGRSMRHPLHIQPYAQQRHPQQPHYSPQMQMSSSSPVGGGAGGAGGGFSPMQRLMHTGAHPNMISPNSMSMMSQQQQHSMQSPHQCHANMMNQQLSPHAYQQHPHHQQQQQHQMSSPNQSMNPPSQ